MWAYPELYGVHAVTHHEVAGLTPAMLALISHVCTRLSEHSDIVVEQASAATVASYSPTMLDVAVQQSVASIPLEDGPLPVQALIYDDHDNLVGELLIWIRAERLIGLEQTWFTDAPPLDWPSPSTVRLS